MPTKTKKRTPSKKERIATLRADVIKRYGPDAMQYLSDPRFEIRRQPSGILSVDYLLHGGFPRGRHTEIYGSANVGKTYVTMRLVAESQARGLTCAFMDAEKTLDAKFAETTGIVKDDLIVHRQKVGTELIDMVETFLYSCEFDVIVIDSIAALLPKEEYEKGMDAGSMGAEQAKMMSKALRKLTAANKDTALIYINQTRENIATIFGQREVTSGGRAMSFYSGLRLQMTRTEQLKQKREIVDPSTGELKTKDVVTGHRVLMRVEKNKTGGARNADQGTFVFDYGRAGHDPIEDLIFIGRDLGWIHKKGDTWWLEGFNHKSKFRSNFYKWLTKDDEARETLTEWITELDYNDEEEEDE